MKNSEARRIMKNRAATHDGNALTEFIPYMLRIKWRSAALFNIAMIWLFLVSPSYPVFAQGCTYMGDQSNPSEVANWINNSSCSVMTLAGDFIGSGGNDNEINVTRSNVIIRGGTSKQGSNATLDNMAFRISASDVTLEYLRFISDGNKGAEAITIGDDCTTWVPLNVNCDQGSGEASRNTVQHNFFTGFYRFAGGGQIIRISPSIHWSHNHNEIRDNEFYNWGGDSSAGNSRAIQVGYQRLNASSGSGHTAWNLTIGTKIVNNIFIHHRAWAPILSSNAITPAPGTASIQLNNPTVVENNCVVGGANGISAKGSYNSVVGNTVLRTRQDGALYMRDGDSNLFAHNIVKSNTGRGFYAWSGRDNVFIRNVFHTNGSVSAEYQAGNFYAQGQIVPKNDNGDRRLGDPTGVPYQADGTPAPISNGETSYKLRSNNLLITRNRFVNDVYAGGTIDMRGTQAGNPRWTNLRSNRVDNVLTHPDELVIVDPISFPPGVNGVTTPINSPAVDFMLNNWTRAKHHKWSDFDNNYHRPRTSWFTSSAIPWASNINVGFNGVLLGPTYNPIAGPCN